MKRIRECKTGKRKNFNENINSSSSNNSYNTNISCYNNNNGIR